jgi:hypothetical protein
LRQRLKAFVWYHRPADITYAVQAAPQPVLHRLQFGKPSLQTVAEQIIGFQSRGELRSRHKPLKVAAVRVLVVARCHEAGNVGGESKMQRIEYRCANQGFLKSAATFGLGAFPRRSFPARADARVDDVRAWGI